MTVIDPMGRIVGQRCKVCFGAVRWIIGGRPSHVYAQDFITPDGNTHPAVLESGEPTHYWQPGVNGAPDHAFSTDVSPEEAAAIQLNLSREWNAAQPIRAAVSAYQLPPDPLGISTWEDLGRPAERQGTIDTIEAPGVNPLPNPEAQS